MSVPSDGNKLSKYETIAATPPTPDLDAMRKSLVDLRQHAINGWVAYGYHQMSREKAERMLREYEEALLAAVSRDTP